MSRSRTVPTLLVSVLVLAMFAVRVSAGANVITRADGKDTPGPLDLASVRVTHGTGANVFRITTWRHFGNQQINGDQGLFEVDLDTNADRNANFYTVVFFKNGRMRGWLFKGNGDRIAGTLAASRVGRRSVQVTVPLAKIGNSKSYDIAVFSEYFATPCRNADPCIDSIPNRYPLIRHDLTPPTFTWNPIPPTYSTDVTANLAFPVRFTVKDDKYGSGVKDWTLQRREVGTSTWVVVKVGTKLAATPRVTGVEQGKSYDLRVIVRDNQGNKTIGPVARTSVPYDDANEFFFTYTAGTWTAGPTTDQFRGATHQGSVGDIVSFDVVAGHEFCILGGPGTDDAEADLAVGADTPQTINETSATAPRKLIHCETPSGIDPIHVVLGVTVGTFVLDGVSIAA